MPLSSGTRFGPYEITGPIGAGGMGEVYRATDSNLKRSVAIKVLPAAMAGDADRLSRFQREAEVLAALNHPNIAAIYGLEKTADLTALVMELVEGEDLSSRLARGAIPIVEALPIARQIADALEAAHEQGIVHRDLKPQNIKVRADGTVKVLDFGLAKIAGEATDGAGSAEKATMTSPAMTAMGIILGTAAYMAPEQAKGKPVDKRADIWAFGVVLCEMLTGRGLFGSDTVAETIAHVITREPDLGALPASAPRRLRDLIAQCLVKEPRQRLRDIGDARLVLDKIAAGAPDDALGTLSPAPTGARRIVWPAIAMLALVIAAGLAGITYFRTDPVPDQVRFTLTPGGSGIVGLLPVLISPDGRKLAYGADRGGRRAIYIYSFESGTEQMLPGTEGFKAAVFVWSPGSDRFAFVSLDQKLKWVSLQGGASGTIAALQQTFTGAWGADDVILLGPTAADGAARTLMKVKVSGGPLEPAATLDAATSETLHRLPVFLPDGRHFSFIGVSPSGRTGYISSLDSPGRHVLPGIVSRPDYSRTHMFYERDEVLFARAFDMRRFVFTGEERRLVDNVGATVTPFSVSRNGTLIYRPGQSSTSQFTWFERSGKELSKVGPVGEYTDIELSLDDRYVAYESGNPGDIWVLDLQNGLTQQVTSHPTREADPVWSPDHKTIAFRSDRELGQIYTRAFGVVADDVRLLTSTTRDQPTSWSKDGKYIAYESAFGIWAASATGEGKPFRVTAPTVSTLQSNGQFSPDGRWIAYQSGELGPQEIFVQAFPGPGARQKVSSAGGFTPRWSHDGRELYYLQPGGRLMAVSVTATAQSIDVRAPVPLFATGLSASPEHGYAVSSSGRFLVAVRTAVSSDPPITVILNWR